MPGETLQRDLAEVLEFWNEHERLGLSPLDIARYLTASLVALTDALRAVPSGEPAPAPHTEAGAVEQPASVGAQYPLSSEEEP